MNQSRALSVALAIMTLLFLSAAALAYHFYVKAGEQEWAAETTKLELTTELANYSSLLSFVLGSIKAPEPSAALPPDEVGVHLGHIVGTSGKQEVTFDWLGSDPNPHALANTNDVPVRQTLRPSLLVRVYLATSLEPEFDDSLVLREVDFKEFNRLLRQGDANSRQLTESDWWVLVFGDEFAFLAQAP